MHSDASQYQYSQDRAMVEDLERERKRHADIQRRRIMVESRIEQMAQSLEESRDRARALCQTASVQEISMQVSRIREENQKAIKGYKDSLDQYEESLKALEELFN